MSLIIVVVRFNSRKYCFDCDEFASETRKHMGWKTTQLHHTEQQDYRSEKLTHNYAHKNLKFNQIFYVTALFLQSEDLVDTGDGSDSSLTDDWCVTARRLTDYLPSVHRHRAPSSVQVLCQRNTELNYVEPQKIDNLNKLSNRGFVLKRFS